MPKRRETPPPPDTLRPLDEPTLGRRIWGLYLQKGYSRAQFAASINVVYSMVVHWDFGDHEPRLEHLRNISQQLDTPLDDLVFGSSGRPRPTKKPPEDAMIMHALDSVRATPSARAAFAEHTQSTAGKYQHFTFDYVQRYAQAFDAELSNGATAHHAAQVAFAEAVNKRAAVSAVLAQPRAPVTTTTAVPGTNSQNAETGSEAQQSSAGKPQKKKRPATSARTTQTSQATSARAKARDE